LEKVFASCVLQSIEEVGLDVFRIHPKGTGVICIDPLGIPPHVVISDYLGEIYPPYRWCERIDVVEKARNSFGLKPTLPDFYNILLERPRIDPKGYGNTSVAFTIVYYIILYVYVHVMSKTGLLFVDASQKANMGSSCSHSCNSNCASSVVARNNKLVIVLTTVCIILYSF
jgi:hypothetical protein